MPQQVELLGFGCGPGSFTGVRIAAAACQAIALAADAPVVAIPSPLALARFDHGRRTAPAHILCSVKSRGEAHYLSTFDVVDAETSNIEQIQADELCDTPPEWLTRDGQDWMGVGARPNWLVAPHVPHWLEGVAPRAADSLPWVRRQHAQGNSQPAELALPRYIAGDSPWKKSA